MSAAFVSRGRQQRSSAEVVSRGCQQRSAAEAGSRGRQRSAAVSATFVISDRSALMLWGGRPNGPRRGQSSESALSSGAMSQGGSAVCGISPWNRSQPIVSSGRYHQPGLGGQCQETCTSEMDLRPSIPADQADQDPVNMSIPADQADQDPVNMSIPADQADQDPRQYVNTGGSGPPSIRQYRRIRRIRTHHSPNDSGS